MKDRLIRLLDSEQLTASKFADKIGVQRSSVSHVLSGRNKPSFDFLQKTLLAFPEVNSDWLILGKGEMISGIPDYTGATLFDIPKDANTITHQGSEDHLSSERAATVSSEQTDLITSEENDKSSQILENAAKEETDPESSDTGKKVVKVMLFYDDNTFRSYDPSN